MAISAAAKSHHDQLSGDRVSALAQSGPELTEYFGNFAFGEVPADAARLDETLDLPTRLMVQLAAILRGNGARAARKHLPAGRHFGQDRGDRGRAEIELFVEFLD